MLEHYQAIESCPLVITLTVWLQHSSGILAPEVLYSYTITLVCLYNDSCINICHNSGMLIQ